MVSASEFPPPRIPRTQHILLPSCRGRMQLAAASHPRESEVSPLYFALRGSGVVVPGWILVSGFWDFRFGGECKRVPMHANVLFLSSQATSADVAKQGEAAGLGPRVWALRFTAWGLASRLLFPSPWTFVLGFPWVVCASPAWQASSSAPCPPAVEVRPFGVLRVLGFRGLALVVHLRLVLPGFTTQGVGLGL